MVKKFKDLTREGQTVLLEEGFYSSQLLEGDFIYCDGEIIFAEGYDENKILDKDVTVNDLKWAYKQFADEFDDGDQSHYLKLDIRQMEDDNLATKKFRDLTDEAQILLLQTGAISCQMIFGDFIFQKDDKIVFCDGVFRKNNESIDGLMNHDVTDDDLRTAYAAKDNCDDYIMADLIDGDIDESDIHVL